MAASASFPLPVAKSAFLQRTMGKPIPSNVAKAPGSNRGSAAKAGGRERGEKGKPRN